MGGFLLNSAYIFSEKGIFLNHHFNNFMLRKDKMDVMSYEVGFSNRTANLKKVFGEFFEREILINNNDSNKNCKISTSIVNGSSKEIAIERLVARSTFVDSCGMASHTKSNSVITSAFLEFFERQSLVANYLTKAKSERISLWTFDNYNDYLLNYVDEVFYFNISLSPKVYVILTLGIGKGKNKCAGLGTAFNLEEAIKKSQIESLQYYATEYSKDSGRNIEKNTNKEENKDLYHRNFDSISAGQFIELYDYLLNETATEINLANIQIESGTNELLTYCHEELGMNPRVSMFPNHRKIPHLKIVKVIDENWFPHLNPKLYSKEMKDYVSNILGATVYNNSWIPFP